MLNPMIAKKAMHTKERVRRIKALIAVEGKRPSAENLRRVIAVLDPLIAKTAMHTKERVRRIRALIAVGEKKTF